MACVLSNRGLNTLSRSKQDDRYRGQLQMACQDQETGVLIVNIESFYILDGQRVTPLLDG